MKTRLFMLGCAVAGLFMALAIHFVPSLLQTAAPQTAALTAAQTAAQLTPPSADAATTNPNDSRRAAKRDDGTPPAQTSATDPTLTAGADDAAAQISPATPRRPRANSYAEGISRAAPAVVSIYTSETIYRSPAPDTNQTNTQSAAGGEGFGTSENSIAPNERRQTNQGSGVIINRDGHILTSYHLIEQVDEIYAALSDGRLFRASLIGADSETDLAVVHIDSQTDLPWCELDNPATLEVGDIVLAIGNPYGVGQTATQGIVSALRRRIAGVSLLQNFVQIDAAINPGNSGGALINPEGDLVGINTAVFSRQNGAQGIGFATPVELIRQVVPQIIRYGRVVRGWLGVGVEDLNNHPGLYQLTNSGAVVAGLFTNSPATQAGLRRGDIVTHINGEVVRSAGQMLTSIARLQPGTVIELEVTRPDSTHSLRATLAERPLFETNNRQ